MVCAASAMTASAIALAADGCGDSSDPSSTAATETRSSTTSQAQSVAPDTAEVLGVTIAPTTAGKPGAVVQSVPPDNKSQLKVGDVIVACNGMRVRSVEELLRAMGAPKLGKQFTVKVIRGSNRFTLTEVSSPTAYLGANVKDATGSVNGAEVVSVLPNSPAASTELERGDVITAVDGAQVESGDDLLQAIGTDSPGDRIAVTVHRGARELDMTTTLASRPIPNSGG